MLQPVTAPLQPVTALTIAVAIARPVLLPAAIVGAMVAPGVVAG